jgi:DNA excision repair protein ERCC-3
MASELSYSTQADQLDLLGRVLQADTAEAGEERLGEDLDDIERYRARRSVGSMRAMSGADGMVYMEYR